MFQLILAVAVRATEGRDGGEVAPLSTLGEMQPEVMLRAANQTIGLVKLLHILRLQVDLCSQQ